MLTSKVSIILCTISVFALAACNNGSSNNTQPQSIDASFDDNTPSSYESVVISWQKTGASSIDYSMASGFLVTNSGQTFMSTYSGNVYSYNGSTWSLLGGQNSLSYGVLPNCMSIVNGILVAATGSTLENYNSGSNNWTQTWQTPDNSQIQSMSDNLLTTTSGKVFQFNGSSWTQIINGNNSTMYFALQNPLQLGMVYGMGQQGVWQYNSTTSAAIKFAPSVPTNSQVIYALPYSGYIMVVLSADGNLWLLTINGSWQNIGATSSPLQMATLAGFYGIIATDSVNIWNYQFNPSSGNGIWSKIGQSPDGAIAAMSSPFMNHGTTLWVATSSGNIWQATLGWQ